MKRAKSIEEQIEDLAKKQLHSIKYYTKTESINYEIDLALKIAPSKSGGLGKNYPDIKLFIQSKNFRYIPVFIEVKGTRGGLIKINSEGEIDNYNKDKSPNFKNIQKYAVNGALHYATAVVNNTETFNESIAIGINGYKNPDNSISIELGAYYISSKNFMIPKKIGEYSDLSFLYSENIDQLIDKIDKIYLSFNELEEISKKVENEIEIKLKNLNQAMEDTYKISVGSRVELVSGMIMAGLGVDNIIAPLEIEELRGEKGLKSNDGQVIINKIDSFLEERNLPKEKKVMIINDLSRVFIYSDLWKPINGESKLKRIYSIVKGELIPIFTSAQHLDFTGKLFNVLNEWVDIPDSDKNDVVLTPRPVTDLMVKLARVNKDSYVWDFATGSAGFLISSMKAMIMDAQARELSKSDLREKIIKIKTEQLLGIEKRSDIYMLAVLNMILMGDGSSNILHKDSLTEYEGDYEQGPLKDIKFPANVFLLNPPYSAEGKGFVFVFKALRKMNSGRAVILIQENSGNGYGLPYTKKILENNTLVASIKMADIFKGKAGVQTAIYVIDIGTPHHKNNLVKFIDFRKDGYQRLNKKKSNQNVNLKNVDNAQERYNEIVNLVLYGSSYLEYFSKNEYIEDTITLNGDDWTFAQHIKFDKNPTYDDFLKTVNNFLSWKLSSMIVGSIQKQKFLDTKVLIKEFESYNKLINDLVEYKEFTIGLDLFSVRPTKSYKYTNPQLYKNKGTTPVVSNSSFNNGIGGFVSLDYTEKGNIITFSDTTLGADTVFYQPYNFIGYSHVQGMYPINDTQWTENSLLYFVTVFKKYAGNQYDYSVKFTRDIVRNLKVKLPINSSGNIDFDFMENITNYIKKTSLKDLLQ